MFEIFLTRNQLVRSINIVEGNEKSGISRKDFGVLLQLIDECLFVITDIDLENVFKELSSISEQYIYWCSQHLCHVNCRKGENPFSISLRKECSSIFHSEIAALLYEDEVDVSTNNNLSHLNTDSRRVPNISERKMVNISSNEIIIYDPYLFDDFSSVLQTVKALRDMYLLSIEDLKIFFIGGNKIIATDSKFRSISDEAFEVFGTDFKFSILKIGDTYHDREFLSNIIRVKSGDSFTWVKKNKGASLRSRGSTIISMSNLFEKRLFHSRQLLNRFFTVIEARYRNPKLKTTTDLEQSLSEVFFTSDFYRYWKIINVDF
jgi:hypothetical protein